MRESPVLSTVLQHFGRQFPLFRYQSGYFVADHSLKARVGQTITPKLIRGLPRVRVGENGAADTVGILPGGQSIWIEVKGTRTRLGEKQRKFGEMILSNGGVWCVARGDNAVADIENAIEIYGAR